MICYRALGFLEITLCLVASLCVTAQTETNANTPVEEAEALAKQLLEKAETGLSSARHVLQFAGTSKLNAEKRAYELAEAEKENVEVQSITQKEKDALNSLMKKCDTVSEVAKQLVDTMKAHLSKAQELDRNIVHYIRVNITYEPRYKKVKVTNEKVKSGAEALHKEINDTVLRITAAKSSLNEIRQLENQSILAEYQFDAILSAGKVNSLLKSAQDNIDLIKERTNEMNVTIGHLKKLYENTSENLTVYISVLYYNAKGSFSAVLHESKKAMNMMKEIYEIKAEIEDAISKVKDTNKLQEAKSHVHTAKWLIREAEKKAQEIKRLLDSVTIYAENANSNKVTAVNEIKRKNPTQDVTFAIYSVTPPQKAENHRPITEVRGSSLQMEIPQTTRSHSDQQGHRSSDNLMNGDSHHAVDESTAEAKNVNLKQARNEAENRLKSDKSGDENDTKFTRGTNGKAQQSLVDTVKHNVHEKVKYMVSEKPELKRHLSSHIGELGDTAVTVSVSLLIALIACAAMH